MSGRDTGQHSFNPPHITPRQDVEFTGSWESVYTELFATARTFGFGEYKRPDAQNIENPTTFSLREAIDLLQQHDQLITERARRMSIRKALIQVPILWEYYGIDTADLGIDGIMNTWIANNGGSAIPQLHNLGMIQTSTGISQIFPTQALKSASWANANYGLSDLSADPTDQSDINDEWRQLYHDPAWDVIRTSSTIVWSGSGQNPNSIRPEEIDPGSANKIALTASATWTRATLRAYTGSLGDSNTEGNADQEKAIYDVLEKYNKIARDH